MMAVDVLPDFNLQDQDVQDAVYVATCAFRASYGRFYAQRYDNADYVFSMKEARVAIKCLLKSGMISSLDELLGLEWHNDGVGDLIHVQDQDGVDDERRVIENLRFGRWDKEFRIPMEFSQFESFRFLTLSGKCVSNVGQISNCTSLKEIFFVCFTALESFSFPVGLTDIRVVDAYIPTGGSILNHDEDNGFPRDSGCIEYVISSLAEYASAIQPGGGCPLENLFLNAAGMNEKLLETFLFDILPYFPTLNYLAVRGIKSVRAIAARMELEGVVNIKLRVEGFPFFSFTSDEEVMAMARFVEFWPCIGDETTYLGDRKWDPQYAEVYYQMFLNKHCRPCFRKVQPLLQSDGTLSVIALYAWARILSRHHNRGTIGWPWKIDYISSVSRNDSFGFRDVDAVFYLLRHGPILNQCLK